MSTLKPTTIFFSYINHIYIYKQYISNNKIIPQQKKKYVYISSKFNKQTLLDLGASGKKKIPILPQTCPYKSAPFPNTSPNQPYISFPPPPPLNTPSFPPHFPPPSTPPSFRPSSSAATMLSPATLCAGDYPKRKRKKKY